MGHYDDCRYPQKVCIRCHTTKEIEWCREVCDTCVEKENQEQLKTFILVREAMSLNERLLEIEEKLFFHPDNV